MEHISNVIPTVLNHVVSFNDLELSPEERQLIKQAVKIFEAQSILIDGVEYQINRGAKAVGPGGCHGA